MKKYIIIFIYLILQSCTLNSNINVRVKKQRMIYDSIHYKAKVFNVNLYTTLEFDKKNLERKDYNDFLLIIEQDTFALVPEFNKLKVNNNRYLEVEYLSHINFESKIYNNDSLSNLIKKKSKIINSKGKIINADEFNIESFIALRNSDSNIKRE